MEREKYNLEDREFQVPEETEREFEDFKESDNETVDDDLDSRIAERIKGSEKVPIDEPLPPEVKETLMLCMERDGLVSKGENGEVVCDLEKIIQYRRDESSFANYLRSKLSYRTATEVIYEVFDDKLIFSPEDYENKMEGEKLEPKSLFYIPKNAQELTDVEKIKQADFYLTASDLKYKKWQSLNRFFENRHGYSAEEAELAVRVFHPKYGDGIITKDYLKVKDPESNEYHRASVDALRKITPILRRGNQVNEAITMSPKVMLSRPEFKNISKLIKPEFFKQREDGEAAKVFRRESAIGKKGSVFIDGAKYTLGTDNEGRILTKLSVGLYGVVEAVGGIKKVIATFKTLPPEEISNRREAAMSRREKGELNTKTPVSANVFVRKSEIDVIPYQSTGSNPRREDESPEEYAERIRGAGNYDMIQRLGKDLSVDSGVGLHNLSMPEQEWLSSYAFTLQDNYDRVVKFAKEYKLEGLKAFIGAEYGQKVGDQILTSGEKLPSAEARELFGEYAKLTQQADIFSQRISESEAVKDEVALNDLRSSLVKQSKEAILRRAKDMLFTAAQIADKGQAKARFFGNQEIIASDIKEVQEGLRQYRQSLEIVNSFVSADIPDQQHSFELVHQEEGVPSSYSFKVSEESGKDSFLTIQLRELGAVQGEHNADREFDGEARINFLFSDSPIALDINDSGRQKALSLRLDREGKTRRGAELFANDPTKKDGEASLDLGSVADVAGRVAAIGNVLSSREVSADQDPQYYHNRESFNKKLGEAEVFATIVRLAKDKVKQKYLS